MTLFASSTYHNLIETTTRNAIEVIGIPSIDISIDAVAYEKVASYDKKKTGSPKRTCFDLCNAK